MSEIEKDPILDEVFGALGSKSRFARALGITPQSVQKWTRVPPYRVLVVEKATGIPRHRIRPDLYPPPPGRKGASVSV
jgi:DNA-binding transcriptional regulator YdaS (Cro superfamily)